MQGGGKSGNVSRHRIVLAIMLAALPTSMIASLMFGAVFIPPGDLFSAIASAFEESKNLAGQIIFSARLARVLCGAMIGATLAIAGLATQTLFRNPLASPYVIGVSSGAAFGAVVGMLMLAGAMGMFAVQIFGVLFGVAAAMAGLIFVRAGRGNEFSLLLAGVAISALFSALTSGALFVAGERLQTLVFWLMGGFWNASWRDAAIISPICVASLVIFRTLAPAMTVSLVGDRSSGDLGVNIPRLRWWLLATISVCASVAVSLTGVIGFVGLIVPHFFRLICGGDVRILLPVSALGGAIFLMLADCVARTVIAPAETPVGVLTATIGAPIFLWMLRNRLAAGRQ